jgi:beta-phosphoglucomutase-like phosphatase (HAD superfamily)
MNLFRAVAWDIDGTLIDSEPLHQRSLVAASAALGADLSDLEPDAFRGVHALDIWKALKPRFSAGATFDAWIAGLEGYYAAHTRELKPIPGALEVMRELQARGVALGVGQIIAFS